MALDMIGRLVYKIKKVFLFPKRLFPQTRFPSLAGQHVSMLWTHMSHTITHEYCHFHIPAVGHTGRAEIRWAQHLGHLSAALLFSRELACANSSSYFPQ
jgi:hypothetical protein